MTATLSIARFELRRRRDVVLSGLVLGVGSVLIPALDRDARHDLDPRALALLLLVALVFAAAALGWVVFGTDVAGVHHRFLLARPVRAREIWLGKVVSCITVVTLGAMGLFWPPFLAGRFLWGRAEGLGALFSVPVEVGVALLLGLGVGFVALALGSLTGSAVRIFAERRNSQR